MSETPEEQALESLEREERAVDREIGIMSMLGIDWPNPVNWIPPGWRLGL